MKEEYFVKDVVSEKCGTIVAEHPSLAAEGFAHEYFDDVMYFDVTTPDGAVRHFVVRASYRAFEERY